MTDALPFESFSEALFESLIERAPDAMIFVDDEDRMLLVNAQTEKMFGYDRSELLERPLEMLIPERYRAKHRLDRSESFRTLRSRPLASGRDFFGLHKDGTEIPVDISIAPVEIDGRVLFASAIRDLRERTRTLAELRRTNERLEAALGEKERFLTLMGHELRTPLTAMLGYTGTLLMRLPGPLNAEQERQLRAMQAIEQHLLSLFEAILRQSTGG